MNEVFKPICQWESTMSEIKITVILTAYNRRVFLKEALDSLLLQDYNKSEMEIIVIKNFPDSHIDQTNDQRIRLFYLPGKSSIGDFLHKAIVESRGELISFLDDDDYFLSNKVTRLVQLFNTNSEVVYIRDNPIYVNENGEKIDKIKKKPIQFSCERYSSEKVLRKGVRELQWNLSCITVRKSVFRGKLEYIKQILAAPDIALFYLAISVKKELCLTNESLTAHRIHDKSITSIMGENNTFVRDYNSLSNLKKLIAQTEVVDDMEKTLVRLRVLSLLYGSKIKSSELSSLLKRYVRSRLYTTKDVLFGALIFILIIFTKIGGIYFYYLIKKLNWIKQNLIPNFKIFP